MKFYVITLFLALTHFTFAQNSEKPQLSIQETAEKIIIDGKLEEEGKNRYTSVENN